MGNRGYTIKLSSNSKDLGSFSNYCTEVILTMIQSEELNNDRNTIIITIPEIFNSKINFSDITYSDKIELYYIGLKQAIETFN